MLNLLLFTEVDDRLAGAGLQRDELLQVQPKMSGVTSVLLCVVEARSLNAELALEQVSQTRLWLLDSNLQGHALSAEEARPSFGITEVSSTNFLELCEQLLLVEFLVVANDTFAAFDAVENGLGVFLAERRVVLEVLFALSVHILRFISDVTCWIEELVVDSADLGGPLLRQVNGADGNLDDLDDEAVPAKPSGLNIECEVAALPLPLFEPHKLLRLGLNQLRNQRIENQGQLISAITMYGDGAANQGQI